MGSKIPVRRNSFSPMRKNGFSTPKIIDKSPKTPVICEENEGNDDDREEDVIKSDLMKLLVQEGSCEKSKDASSLIADQFRLPVSGVDSIVSLSSANSTNSILENYRPRSKTSVTFCSNSIIPPSNKYQSDADQDIESARDVSPALTSSLKAVDEVNIKDRNKLGDAKYPLKFLSNDKPTTVAEAIMLANASKYSHVPNSVSSQQHVILKSSVAAPLFTATTFSSPPARTQSSSSSTYDALSPILQQQNSVSHYSNSPDISIFSPEQNVKFSSEKEKESYDSLRKETVGPPLAHPSTTSRSQSLGSTSIRFSSETHNLKTDFENDSGAECSVVENDNMLQDFYPNETSFFIGELTESAKKSIHNGTLEPSPQLVDQFFSVYKEIFHANSGHENIEEIQKSVCSENGNSEINRKLLGDENEEEFDAELSMLWETETDDLLSETGEIYEDEIEYIQEKKFSLVSFVKIFSVLLFVAVSCVGGFIGLDLMNFESSKVSPSLFDFAEDYNSVLPRMFLATQEPSPSPSTVVEPNTEETDSQLPSIGINYVMPVLSDDIVELDVALDRPRSELIASGDNVEDIELSIDITDPVENNTDSENTVFPSNSEDNVSSVEDLNIESIDVQESETQYYNFSDMQVAILYVADDAWTAAESSISDNDNNNSYDAQNERMPTVSYDAGQDEEVLIIDDIASNFHDEDQLFLRAVEETEQQSDEGDDFDQLHASTSDNLAGQGEMEITNVVDMEPVPEVGPISEKNSDSVSAIVTATEETTEIQILILSNNQVSEEEMTTIDEFDQNEVERSEEESNANSVSIEIDVTVSQDSYEAPEETITTEQELTDISPMYSTIMSPVSSEVNGGQEIIEIDTVEITDISSDMNTEKSNKPYSPVTLFIGSGLLSVISCFIIFVYTIMGMRKKNLVRENVLGNIQKLQTNVPGVELAMFSSLKMGNVPSTLSGNDVEEETNIPFIEMREVEVEIEIVDEAVAEVEEEIIQEIEVQKKMKKSSNLVVEKRVTRNAAKNFPELCPEEPSLSSQRTTRLKKKN